ncbi:hypothetical protein [Clostridium perfringens]|uniref:hypothetical protein n=1 Tax=Clostridium perfringens TaxID=1502 RepID=UPI001128B36E|nr:hypothetical protein [Clostridium perfringens]TPF98653.1 hypothetical protein XA71_12625 [Clostridium perfringens A]
MNILSLITDNLMEMIMPMALIVAFIAMIYIVVILCLDCMTRVRHRNECEEDDEDEDDEWDMLQKAIIVIGDAKIEIEVDYYEIDCNIINIKGKDGELYVTDLKNVLLSSNETHSEAA